MNLFILSDSITLANRNRILRDQMQLEADAREALPFVSFHALRRPLA